LGGIVKTFLIALVFCISLVVSFRVGQNYGTEKIVKVAERIYDFKQEPDKIKQYASYTNMVLLDQEEYAALEQDLYHKGFRDGYRKAEGIPYKW